MTTPESSISAQQPAAIREASEPGCLIQALWFIFIGWWLGGWAILIAWVLNITILGLPLGLWILNNIPRILALQSPKKELQVITSDGKLLIQQSNLEQHNSFFRALYFLLIGWWWSLVWLLVGYIFCATIIGLPVGLLMFRYVPMMTTLKRY